MCCPSYRTRRLPEYREAGVSKEKTIITHCQAAIRGAFMAITLEMLGYPVPLLYDGSMAEWANLEDTLLEAETA